MKPYEIDFLISPDLTDEETKSLQEKIASIIQREGGNIKGLRNAARIKLGYFIKDSLGLKKFNAYSASIAFDMEEKNIEGFDKKIKLEDQILRYLIIFKKPKPIFQPRIRRAREEKVIPIFKEEPLESLSDEQKPKQEKVELNEIEKKLEEILGE